MWLLKQRGGFAGRFSTKTKAGSSEQQEDLESSMKSASDEREQHLDSWLQEFRIADLPEDCLLSIFSHLPFPEVLLLAGVCKQWKAIIYSDQLWDKHIPQSLSSLVVDEIPSMVGRAKRKVFKEFFQGCLYSNGLKVFLDPSSHLSTTCISVADEMDVTWWGSPEYWEAREVAPSGNVENFVKGSLKTKPVFSKLAHLLMVCWFEINLEKTILLAPGSYSVSWRISRDQNSFRWYNEPAECIVNLNGEEQLSRELEISKQSVAVFPRWTEFEVGEIVVHAPAKAAATTTESLSAMNSCWLCPVYLKLVLREYRCGWWKQGVYLDCLVFKQLSHTTD